MDRVRPLNVHGMNASWNDNGRRLGLHPILTTNIKAITQKPPIALPLLVFSMEMNSHSSVSPKTPALIRLKRKYIQIHIDTSTCNATTGKSCLAIRVAGQASISC